MNKNSAPVDSKFGGEIDPEIANLMGIENSGDVAVPEFDALFDENIHADDDIGSLLDGEDVVPRARKFVRPEKIEEAPKPLFQDQNYYKLVLGGEGEVSQKVHSTFSSFMKSSDPQEKSQFRGRLIPAYWDLLGSMAVKILRNLPQPKQVFLRYSILLPAALTPEQREMFSKIIWDNNSGEPVYYVDEWLVAVARGNVSISAQDEVKISRKDNHQKMTALLERARGRLEAHQNLIRGTNEEMKALETQLANCMQGIAEHQGRDDFPSLKLPYTEAQRGLFNNINESVRRLATLNKDLARYHQEMDSIVKNITDLKQKDSELGQTAVVDNKTIMAETNSLRQMAKMCIGRQGNHFPILIKQYIRSNIMDIATRENIINAMADVEYIDPGLFLRTFKQQTNRIVPNVILLPSYGDTGVCWEPFERFNRATSRGRIAIPLYPKDLKYAVVSALADLRWQTAKEKAQHYWMEEGLTGWYYQWFSDRKMKGDVREAFIQDYILWVMKESEGTQKLDRDVRGIFWRYLPFPQELKDKLKTRGFVYAELAKKDANRSMSDGY
ncbi:MAG: hypothetical protein LBK44_06700 [Spirochaetales bacterium]|jgi:hypothetical protein|nr:hypothetical protein [Spirochaetales bacterium]